MKVYFKNYQNVKNVIAVLDGEKEFCCFKGSFKRGGVEVPIIVVHGTPSLKVNKQKIENLPLREDFKKEACYLTCWGSRFPREIKHLIRTNGPVAVTGFYEVLTDGSFYMEIEDRAE